MIQIRSIYTPNKDENMDFLVDECDTNILIDKCKTQTSKLSNYKLEDSLSLILLNFQSIMSKRKSFWEMLDNCSPDIVVGCETWLRPSILDNEIFPQNYNLYRTDRSDGFGGAIISYRYPLSINKNQLLVCLLTAVLRS